MANFDLNSILKVVAGDGVNALAKSAKADEKKVSTLVSAAVPLLIGKMQETIVHDISHAISSVPQALSL